jgi:cytochrome c-type biogenesis protein CcmH
LVKKLFFMPESKYFKSGWTVFMLVGLWLLAAGCDSGPPQDSVSGTIRLDPEIRSKARRAQTMFIVLSPEGGGPPLAVQRLVRVEFPFKYVLTKDDVMIQGRSFTGKVKVRVRLDADGKVGPFVRGDFMGENPKAVPIGARDVDVVVNRAGTAEPPKVAKRKSPPRQPAPVMSEPRGRTRPSVLGGGRTISGTIVVAPGLAAKAAGKPVLFIIARTERPGPPLAVVKMENPKFPAKFTLSQADVMMQGRPFQGNLRITARLDSDGSAGPVQPGDIEGASAGLVPVGAKDVVITLDKER